MLETIGYDAAMGRWAAAPDASLGRVARVAEGLATVLTRNGPRLVSFGGSLLNLMCADHSRGPCTGDWCVLRQWPGHRVTLEQVLPRRTAVVRAAPGRHGHDQVLCANLDLCAVVVALAPRPAAADVHELVRLASTSGAPVLVVLTRSEGAPRGAADEVARAVPGAETVAVGSEPGAGVDTLRARLEGRLTLAVLSTPGQGMSSLTRALVGAEPLGRRDGVGGRRRGARPGSELVPVPGGGAVMAVRVMPRDARSASSAG